MKRLQLLTALLVALPAFAGDADQQVYVDLEKVVAAGKVTPVDGITAAGQPDAAALKVFVESGFATVVDMRGPDEDRGMEDFPAAVSATGMRYVAFPITESEQISFATAAELDAMLAELQGPVLLHCASGNRVGALLALRASLKGADNETAIAFGQDAGMTRLEPQVREILEAK